jgi:hypothetical protein
MLSFDASGVVCRKCSFPLIPITFPLAVSSLIIVPHMLHIQFNAHEMFLKGHLEESGSGYIRMAESRPEAVTPTPLFLYGLAIHLEKFTTPALEPPYARTADGRIRTARTPGISDSHTQ